MGIIPIGFDPMNQTTSIGKFPIGMNPPKFLPCSYESNKPPRKFQLSMKGCSDKTVNLDCRNFISFQSLGQRMVQTHLSRSS